MNNGSITTFRLPNHSKVITVTDEQEAQQALADARRHHRRVLVIGGGSNLLLPPNCQALILRLADDNQPPKIDGQGRLSVWAGTMTSRLAWTTLRAGYGSLANFAALPGTIGGAVWNNSHGYAGALIGDCVCQVTGFEVSTGEKRISDTRAGDFGYEASPWQTQDFLITGVTFDVGQALTAQAQAQLRQEIMTYLRYKSGTQPLSEPSAGCFWRNPPNTDLLRCHFPQFAQQEFFPAGVLVEAVAHNLSVGDARVSDRHHSFIVNAGNASYGDILALAREIKARVDATFSVQLIPEVTIIDRAGRKISL